MKPDFTKLPDLPEPPDSHERGVLLLYVLMAILLLVMLYGASGQQ